MLKHGRPPWGILPPTISNKAALSFRFLTFLKNMANMFLQSTKSSLSSIKRIKPWYNSATGFSRF